MTEVEFRALAAQGFNRIPLTIEAYADLDTPLSLYLKLANRPSSFLLESVEGGERFGRYSFIGLPARTSIRVRRESVEVVTDEAVVERHEGNPLEFIESFSRRFKAAPQLGLPRFCGGLAGYFGYDTIRYIEKKLAGGWKEDPLGIPDILLLLTEELAVIDNLAGKIYLIVYADPSRPDAFMLGMQRLRELRMKLRSPVDIPYQRASQPTEAVSEWGREPFKAAVARAREYIAAGDIMQVVVSQRMRMPFPDSPLSLYRALRSTNPSPYMFFYDFGEFHLIGASPEILVRLEGDAVTVRPIAGTRPRGGTRERDEALAEDLLSDEKERAEHVMLLDLGRNDVGRVARTGSVRVTEQMVIERYSHVMHIVSNVEGVLKPGLSALDVLKASFPAGTVSGAPKVRAMEIIDELEPVKRGFYAGAVGYLSFQGDMDLCIALRTGLLKDRILYIQAGGGIVYDSDPEAEWQETQNKARAMLRAAQKVQFGLDAEV